jgi:hypothetical protein
MSERAPRILHTPGAHVWRINVPEKSFSSLLKVSVVGHII